MDEWATDAAQVAEWHERLAPILAVGLEALAGS